MLGQSTRSQHQGYDQGPLVQSNTAMQVAIVDAAIIFTAPLRSMSVMAMLQQRRAGMASKNPTTVFDPCSFDYAVTTGSCVATLLFPLSIAAASSRSSAALSPR